VPMRSIAPLLCSFSLRQQGTYLFCAWFFRSKSEKTKHEEKENA
jgi:hypothetical protein